MSARRDEKHFHECFRSLSRYRDERGTFAMLNSYTDANGRRVGAWLYRIRKAYEEGRLPQDRVDMFVRIGYNFDEHKIGSIGGTPQRKKKKVSSLSASSSSAAKTTPKPPPSSSASAAATATAMPSSSSAKSKKDKKSTDRVRVDTWDKNFDRLVRFKEEHGHLLPNYGTHKALRMWVNRQTEKWYYGDLEEDRANRLRELGVPEPESDGTEGGYDEGNHHDEGGADNNKEASNGEGAAAGAVDDELASWEPGIATRSAKKKRKMELGEFLSSTDASAGAPPHAKRAATGGGGGSAAASAAAGEQEPQPSFLACVYQAVSEKVTSFFFSKNAPAAATNE